MKIDDMFRSAYMKASDLGGKVKRFTIAGVAVEEIGPDKERKAVVSFDESELGLVLNRTNAEILSGSWGKETDDWVGNRVLLVPEKTMFAGKRVDCVRVRPQPLAAAQSRPDPDPASEDVGEEVSL